MELLRSRGVKCSVIAAPLAAYPFRVRGQSAGSAKRSRRILYNFQRGGSFWYGAWNSSELKCYANNMIIFGGEVELGG
jgi:hypothetical protein